MNTTDIRRVVLTMDDSDVQRRTENLTRRLTNTKRIKDQLEIKATASLGKYLIGRAMLVPQLFQ